MRKICIIGLFICFTGVLYAQSVSVSSIKTQLDAMFSGLDKTKVPTGFLWDTAVNLVDSEAYNGSALTDSNYVSLSIMGDMLQSINSASVGADTINVQAALQRIQNQSTASNQLVGILFQPYNYIVENALTDNLIDYSNGIVSDVYQGGVWQNPYGEDVLFGFTIGNSGVVGQNTTFTITNIDSLSTQTFQNIQFDPGDGNGYRNVSLNGTISVVYPETGCAETRLKVTVDGHIYQSHGLINIVDSYAPHQSGVHSSPEYTYAEKSVLFQGLSYKARIVYKNSVSFSKRPLIVSEGFDPWRLDPKSSSNDFSGFTNIESLVDKGPGRTLFNSYDVFYVDWYDCGADIRANAEVLKEVIRWVNDHNQSGEPNIVLGQSMGGLIARYALRDMELEGESHNTTLFISHDVPYVGANVSPGFLFLYRDLNDLTDNLLIQLGAFLFSKHSREFFEFRRLGSYQSVKQLLHNYVDDTWNYNNVEFYALQNELSLMGFPQGDKAHPIENIAIVNGGTTASGATSFYVPGDKLLDADISVSTTFLSETLLTFLSYLAIKKGIPFIWAPGKSTIHSTYDIYPYFTNNSLIAKSKVTFTKKFLWLADVVFTLNDKRHYSPASGVALDAVASSIYELKNLTIDTEIDTTHTTWMYSFTANISAKDSLMFVPIASAMAMPNDYRRDFMSDLPTPKVDTPFDSFILPPSAKDHIEFFSDVSLWLNTVVNNQLSGPDIVCSSDSFSIVGPDSASFSWSTSNSSVATIDSNGQLTTINDGIVDVIARKDYGKSVITKRKRILAGMPKMVLDCSSTDDGYTVTADFVSDAVKEFVMTTPLKDSLRYKWQLVTDDSIQTIVDTSRTFNVVVDSLTTLVSVSFNVVYGNTESVQSSLVLRNPDYYSYNVHGITRRMGGTFYFSLLVEPVFGEITSFKIWIERNGFYMVPGPQDHLPYIKALGKTFEGSFAMVNDIPCVCFDLFWDSDVADLINSVSSTNPEETLFLYLYDPDDHLKQVVQIPIMYPNH